MSVTVAALILLSQPVAAAPTDPRVWAWDDTIPTCALKHQSRSPAEATLTVERTPGNDATDVMITLAAGSRTRDGQFANATVATDSGRTFVANVSAHASEVFLDSPDPEFIENLARTASLQISHSKLGSVRVPVDVPPEVISLLRQCEDETMTIWGLDAAAWHNLKTRPQPLSPPLARFRASDYPPEAAQRGAQADSIIRLDIAPDGRVSACNALNRTTKDLALFKSFESVSCAVLKGATFRPATDQTGRPVSAPIVYDVKYRLAE